MTVGEKGREERGVSVHDGMIEGGDRKPSWRGKAGGWKRDTYSPRTGFKGLTRKNRSALTSRSRRAATHTHFFSDPIDSFRDVYCPFSVLYITQPPRQKKKEREESATTAHSNRIEWRRATRQGRKKKTHDEPLEDSKMSLLWRLAVRDRGEQLWTLAPVGCTS